MHPEGHIRRFHEKTQLAAGSALSRTAGPSCAAPVLPLIILSALRAALSGLRFTIQILDLAGLARTCRRLTLALRK